MFIYPFPRTRSDKNNVRYLEMKKILKKGLRFSGLKLHVKLARVISRVLPRNSLIPQSISLYYFKKKNCQLFSSN